MGAHSPPPSATAEAGGRDETSGTIRRAQRLPNRDSAQLVHVAVGAVQHGNERCAQLQAPEATRGDLVAVGPELPVPIGPGVLIEEGGRSDIYLFDTRLGLPLPGPGGNGIATLAQLREQADLLTRIVTNGSLSLDVDALRFPKGQDLIDLVAAMRTELKAGEVKQ